jgi:hypothetical protein
MGENVPCTSYLSQKLHSFIKKYNFGDNLNLFKKFFCVQVQGVKNAPLKKILARTLNIQQDMSKHRKEGCPSDSTQSPGATY